MNLKFYYRHLQGCYVDIDETFSKFDQLQDRWVFIYNDEKNIIDTTL